MPTGRRITEAGQVVSAYARWAPVYDLAFTAVMRPGRMAAADGREPRRRRRAGGSSTSASAPASNCRCSTRRARAIVGIDLAGGDAACGAQRRVARERLGHVDGLLVMDATRLAFPDGAFDAAVVPYVLTVVPEPRAMLDEVRRVVRPGGEIVLVNHFGAERGPVAAVEGWLGKRSASLGWHPQFPFAILGDWIAATPGMVLVERRRIRPFGLFQLVRLRRDL